MEPILSFTIKNVLIIRDFYKNRKKRRTKEKMSPKKHPSADNIYETERLILRPMSRQDKDFNL